MNLRILFPLFVILTLFGKTGLATKHLTESEDETKTPRAQAHLVVNNLSDFPEELFLKIVTSSRSLSVQDICHIGQCSKEFNRLMNDEKIWKERYYQDLHLQSVPSPLEMEVIAQFQLRGLVQVFRDNISYADNVSSWKKLYGLIYDFRNKFGFYWVPHSASSQQGTLTNPSEVIEFMDSKNENYLQQIKLAYSRKRFSNYLKKLTGSAPLESLGRSLEDLNHYSTQALAGFINFLKGLSVSLPKAIKEGSPLLFFLQQEIEKTSKGLQYIKKRVAGINGSRVANHSWNLENHGMPPKWSGVTAKIVGSSPEDGARDGLMGFLLLIFQYSPLVFKPMLKPSELPSHYLFMTMPDIG